MLNSAVIAETSLQTIIQWITSRQIIPRQKKCKNSEKCLAKKYFKSILNITLIFDIITEEDPKNKHT